MTAYDATSLDTRRDNPAYLLTDASDAPEIPASVLSAAARLHATEIYPVGKDTWQMERYGRASTLRRELEALGFVVRSATNDRLDDQPYTYAMFREGVK